MGNTGIAYLQINSLEGILQMMILKLTEKTLHLQDLSKELFMILSKIFTRK